MGGGIGRPGDDEQARSDPKGGDSGEPMRSAKPSRRAKALEAVGPIGTEQSSRAGKLVKSARSARSDGEPRRWS